MVVAPQGLLLSFRFGLGPWSRVYDFIVDIINGLGFAFPLALASHAQLRVFVFDSTYLCLPFAMLVGRTRASPALHEGSD